ncbi:hypothetical protein SEVIR_4G048550v4 [Setaria viridis]
MVSFCVQEELHGSRFLFGYFSGPVSVSRQDAIAWQLLPLENSVTPFHREARELRCPAGLLSSSREKRRKPSLLSVTWAIRLNGSPDSLNWLTYVLHARFAWPSVRMSSPFSLLALSLARGLSNQSNIIGHAFGMIHYFLSYFKPRLTLKKPKPNTDDYKFLRNFHSNKVASYYNDIYVAGTSRS